MAEIDIERRRKTPWGWLLVGLLVVILAAAAFLFYTDAGQGLMGRGDGMEPDTAEILAPPGTEPPPPAGGQPR